MDAEGNPVDLTPVEIDVEDEAAESDEPEAAESDDTTDEVSDDESEE